MRISRIEALCKLCRTGIPFQQTSRIGFVPSPEVGGFSVKGSHFDQERWTKAEFFFLELLSSGINEMFAVFHDTSFICHTSIIYTPLHHQHIHVIIL